MDTLPDSVRKQLPAMVRHEVARMSPQHQEEFLEEFNRKSKDIAVCYILWFLLGLHYAYVRKWGLLILMWITFGGFVIWWIVDIFRIPGVVRDYNRDVALAVLRDQKAIAGPSS